MAIVELEPWHAIDIDKDNFVYVKLALDASDPRLDAEPAFVLLATDLLSVWAFSVTHGGKDGAPTWITEQHSNLVVDDHMEPLRNMRAVLLGINQQHAPRIRLSDSSALLIDVPIASRIRFKLTCEPLAPAEAALVLREQMLLPMLHMSALFAERARVDGWDAATASRAAEEHVNRGAPRLEFHGAIATVYQTMMARRTSRGAQPPAALEHTGDPAGGEASTMPVPLDVAPVAAPNDASQNGGGDASKKRPMLVVNPAMPKRDPRLPR